MHLVITMAIRGYLSYAIHNAQPKLCNVCLSKGRLTLVLLTFPIITGLLHSYFFDDRKLYKFGNSDVGSTCQLGFGTSSTLGTVYLYGVVQQRIADGAVEENQTDLETEKLIDNKHITSSKTDVEDSLPPHQQQNNSTTKSRKMKLSPQPSLCFA